MMEAVVAVYSDWGIGCGGTQPVAVSADRRHFRELTSGGTVIVGRKTLADFPGGRPLRDRRNIVISGSLSAIEGAELAKSPVEAADLVRGERAYVIGGASVYAAMLEHCERAHVTFVDAAPESDVFFPNLDESPDWSCTDPGQWLEEGGVRYRFAEYVRRK